MKDSRHSCETTERANDSDAARSRNTQPLNIRSVLAARRTRTGKLIDAIGVWLARPALFVVLLALHVAWIVCNLGWIPGLPVWDAPPFALLSSISSVEAPFMTLLILMRQQRDARIAEVREELLLQFVLHMDRELSGQHGHRRLKAEPMLDDIVRELNRDEGLIDREGAVSARV